MPAGHAHPTRFWRDLADGRVQCDVCPRECRLREGQRGFCFVRASQDAAVVWGELPLALPDVPDLFGRILPGPFCGDQDRHINRVVRRTQLVVVDEFEAGAMEQLDPA